MMKRFYIFLKKKQFQPQSTVCVMISANSVFCVYVFPLFEEEIKRKDIDNHLDNLFDIFLRVNRRVDI